MGNKMQAPRMLSGRHAREEQRLRKHWQLVGAERGGQGRPRCTHSKAMVRSSTPPF